MFRQRLAWLAGMAVLGGIATFFFTLWVLGSAPQGPQELEHEDGRSRIEEGAELVRIFVYQDGEEGSPALSSVPPELVGLSSSELMAARPEWRLVSFGSHRVVVEEACTELSGGFIREVQGTIRVYEGSLDGCHRPVDTLDFDASRLSPLQRAELQAGIPYLASDDLALLLDGMQAP